MKTAQHKKSGKFYTYIGLIIDKTRDEEVILYTDGCDLYTRQKDDFFNKFNIEETNDTVDYFIIHNKNNMYW